MGFFKNLFFTNQSVDNQPEIQFGRFSDSYKEEEKYDAWDRALEHFEAESYVNSYREFFKYLMDDDLENVKLDYKNGMLNFTIYQGSKIIVGWADHSKFYAEAKIASCTRPNIAVFRKLLEDNYLMKYSKYAIDEKQTITNIFTTPAADSSPYKLYYALKEMATHADNSDDVLTNKYEELLPINTSHIRSISESEKELKYRYLQDAIDEALTAVDDSELNISRHPGALSYVYLDLLYRMDYLLKPEGDTKEKIAHINKEYFKESTKTLKSKNAEIRHSINQLRKISAPEFAKELYEVKSTFGMNSPSAQSRIKEFIKSEITNMDWYLENGHKSIALAIPSYIVGYSLYNYSMPAPLRAFLQLFYRVVEYPFFEALGFQDNFVDKDTNLNKQRIKAALKQVTKIYADDYEEVDPKYKNIDYTNVFSFARSYMLLLSGLDFTRKDLR